ncbi:putative hydroxypyruvate isomerase [Streptomyces sulfonofaciens]|uniref:Hydroxypyruvate isomerase n=1 Tax=Streptomyces sulfonofaciens TaxID=68272 RepID=A0A919G7E9_9ACTN|nr:TIM barrel protein [Streptomyces sulfonofaciens]GHH79433.1 putative hydroxypyruvate isomerase [Streptomyces sulfonofaciens]
MAPLPSPSPSDPATPDGAAAAPHPGPGAAFGTDHRFDVNLSILFTELPLLERPAAAAAAGFGAVELWWPWVETPTPERARLDALRGAIEDAGVRLVGLNFYAGRLPGPDRGALSVPGAESEKFRANVDVAADFADSLGCRALNALYGNRVEGVHPAEQDALALENLRIAALAADRIGASLLIEALNRPESPRCPIVSAPKAVEIVDRVNEVTGLDNARFLMDLYHLSMNGEDLPSVIDRYADRTAHVQIADNPGRGAPGTGSLPLADLLGRLRKAGYDGWIGLEYRPGERPSAEAFDWLPAAARTAR